MKKIRFNAIDCILVVILLLGMAFAGFRFFGGGFGSTETKNVTVEYEAEFKRKTESFKNAVSVGDKVVISAKERDEGVVTEVSYVPAERVELNRIEEKYVVSNIPNHYDVIVKVRAAAVETENDIMVGSTSVRIGEKSIIRGKGYAAEGYVLTSDIVD